MIAADDHVKIIPNNSLNSFAPHPQLTPTLMQPIDSAYITRHNLKRLSRFWLQPDGDISIDHIFSVIYSQPLSEILNNKEATYLFIQKQLINQKLENIIIKKKHFNPSYIFSVGPPKFHKDKECKYLSADFLNYLVPPEIKALGEEKIKEFQEYCETNKKEFNEKTEDVFWARINARFRVHVAPQSIHYENSGVQGVKSMSIEMLQAHINEYISEILSMLKNESRARSLEKFRYAPNLKFAISKISDEKIKKEIEEFFNLKQDLINSLFELYRRQGQVEEYILPVTLLEACGLEPCKGCSR